MSSPLADAAPPTPGRRRHERRKKQKGDNHSPDMYDFNLSIKSDQRRHIGVVASSWDASGAAGSVARPRLPEDALKGHGVPEMLFA
ncbi:hypothetical protein ZIOFF_071866 [Zingiber officinale]|uniref:Uncharacterized protein n=1 Tax=Zingiber officinale TaxID=94328 RepID=A0A8J5BES3_ZINOF|nr:hypothetical protein ZIOFF_071866 [Zingiber officinale]